MNINRYPGTIPFSREYQDVFFGRDQDVKNVGKYVTVNNLAVLHGKSGLGKSSLINAGLVPHLEEVEGYKCLFVRFSAFNETDSKSLSTKLFEAINQHLPPEHIFHDFLNLKFTDQIHWLLIKELECHVGIEKKILIVIDQFEEVFTYPDDQLTKLVKDLGQVLYNRIPTNIQETLINQARIESQYHTQEQLDLFKFLGVTNDIHFLLGIRSDKLSLLNRLKKELPTIMMNHYELFPLGWSQAHKAITDPAIKTHFESDVINISSPSFLISDSLTESILLYLTKNKTKPIETFLLQIICSHLESLIIRKEIEGSVIETKHVPDLQSITKRYYVSILESQDAIKPKTDENLALQRILIRYIVEKVLIDFRNMYRVSIDKNYLENQGIPHALIDFLINVRIIRREPNSVDGVNLELSHDILIEAVRLSMQEMNPLDDEIKAYYQQEVDKKSQRFIEKLFLGKQSNLKITKGEVPNSANLDKLLEKRVLRFDEDDTLEINPVFSEAAKEIQSAAHAKKSIKRRKSLLAVIAFSILILISTGLVVSKNSELQVTQNNLEDALDSAATLYEASLDSAQVLLLLRQKEIANAEESDSLRKKAEKEAKISDSLTQVSVARFNTSQRLQALNDTLTSIETIRTAIPLITFPRSQLSKRSIQLDSMLSIYMKYKGPEDKSVLKKAIEMLLLSGLNVFRIDSLGDRITSLNFMDNNLVVSTSRKLVKYPLKLNPPVKQTIQDGFYFKNCILTHKKNEVACYGENTPELRFFNLNDSISSYNIQLGIDGRINAAISTTQGIFMLWESGLLTNFYLPDRLGNTNTTINDFDTLALNVRDVKLNGANLLILEDDELTLKHVEHPLDTTPYYDFILPEKFEYILTSQNNDKVILYNSAGSHTTIFKTTSFPIVMELPKGKIHIESSPFQSIFASYSLKTIELSNDLPTQPSFLSFKVDQGISRIAFDNHESEIYIGTYSGEVFRIPITLKDLHPIINDFVTKMYKE